MNNDNHEVGYTYFPSLTSVHDNTELITTWSQLCDVLSKPAICQSQEEKDRLGLFNGAIFADSRRKREKAIAISMVILDFDGGMTIEEAKSFYPNHEYYLYSSFNHQYDKKGDGTKGDRFRMVFPLSEPITADHWDQIHHVLSTFAPGVDAASEKITQPFTLPCHRPQAPYVAFRNRGKLLDVTRWERRAGDERPVMATKRAGWRSNKVRVSEKKLRPNDGLYSKKLKAFTPALVHINKLVPQVMCPFHADKSPGEYFVRVTEALAFLHCHKCGRIYVDFPLPDRPLTSKPLSLDARKTFIDRHITAFLHNKKYKHLLLLGREGFGKTHYSIDTVLNNHMKVLICNKSNKQAEEKYDTLIDKYSKVQVILSRAYLLESRYGVKPVMQPGTTPWDPATINEKATMGKIVAAYGPDKAVGIWLETQAREPQFQHNNIIVTSIDRMLLWAKQRLKTIPADYVIYIDDPSIGDIACLADDGTENDKRFHDYYVKPEQYRLVDRFRNRVVYTTTEQLTGDLIMKQCKKQNIDLLTSNADETTVFEDCNLWIIKTELTKSKYDGLIPVMMEKVKRQGWDFEYVADGQGQANNLVNTKGQNAFIGKNIVAEVSYPNDKAVVRAYDELQYWSGPKGPGKRDVARMMAVDVAHQIIGRNDAAGYRGLNEPISEEFVTIDSNKSNTVLIVDVNIGDALIAQSRYRPVAVADLKNNLPIDQAKWIGMSGAVLAIVHNPEKLFTSVDDVIELLNQALSASRDPLRMIQRFLTAMITFKSELLNDLESWYIVAKDTNLVVPQEISDKADVVSVLENIGEVLGIRVLNRPLEVRQVSL